MDMVLSQMQLSRKSPFLKQQLFGMLERLIMTFGLMVLLTAIAYIFYEQIRKQCEHEVFYLRIFLVLTNFVFMVVFVLSPLMLAMTMGYYVELGMRDKNDPNIEPGMMTFLLGILLSIGLYMGIYRLQQRSAAPTSSTYVPPTVPLPTA